ncbi:Predicted arabinose efflux permease, MFS family [Nakamurella panacisegetis]|uniref:Predicted arabinose efflux permease, MFS family n=1 Tax=Nakamurella panacisegetis TaxID=1090615 RepID=A0A1H0ISG8_9ACTN|nr:MFS transporter [Nakamurella panacisegetis]SDO34253.1 Predicted arabinose efflux permease, MFS family [Nakamurella panacisegetis]
MTETAPRVGKPGEVAHVDPKNVRRAAWAGMVGTALEQYDFIIYGTASALIFSKLFFPNISPVAGLIASFSAYAIGFLARPLGGLFFAHFGERYGRKWVLVSTLFLMGAATFLIGCLPTFKSVGVLAPILLVVLRFLQGFGAGAEQAGGATLLTETAPLGRRGRLSSFVMVGAALGTVLGATAWVLAQKLPDDILMSWGWRMIFWASIFVTAGAWIIRVRMAESPIFEELKKAIDVEHAAPLKDVAKHGKKNVLKVIFMNWGISTQSYTYQVFMASYLVTFVHVNKSFVPNVLLYGAQFGAVAAYVMGVLADKIGRRRMFLILAGAAILIPFPAFIALNTGSHFWIIVVMALGFITAAQGITAVTMSFFPEMFGARYRYAGVTLGREFSSIIGGGVAPLVATGLMAWFFNSWIPVAAYMVLTMVVSFLIARTVPETADRDLQVLTDAQPGESRLGVAGSDQTSSHTVGALRPSPEPASVPTI